MSSAAMHKVPGAQTKGTILVVDDEEVVCHSCKRIFEGDGFSVETCADARQGLRLAEQGEHTAILLDIKMPAMSGIRFLEQLRRSRPHVPVVMITGYPSAGSAAAARRLGAAGYVHKPFTPDELTGAVLAALAEGADTGEEEAAAERGQVQPWLPICEDYDFLDGSWLQIGRDGTARVGIFPSRAEARGFVGLTLPRVGESLCRGLPLLTVSHADGWSRTYPSPLCGEVLEINESLRQSPRAPWEDPCHEGWVARVRPVRIIRDLWACNTRSVVLLSHDDSMRDLERYWLERLGCAVFPATTERDALQELRETDSPVLAIDARSFAAEGPGIIAAINAQLADVKVIVLAGPTSEHEAAYRAERIFNYAVDPFLDNELVDILAAAFAAPSPPQESRDGGPVLEWIDRFRLTTREGLSVSLMAGRRLLPRDRGLAAQLIRLAKQSRLPFSLRCGAEPATAADVLAELAAHDRVLLLKIPAQPRLPGCLTVRPPQDEILELDDKPGALVVLEVQPSADDVASLCFDHRTTQALAEHVFAAMTQE